MTLDVLGVAVIWALASLAPASEITTATREAIELSWQTPPGVCPSADEVLDDALHALGRVPPPGATMRAEAIIVNEADVLVMVLDVEGQHGRGTRRVQASRCRELGRIAALVIALAIDPEAIERMPLGELPAHDTATPPAVVAEPVPAAPQHSVPAPALPAVRAAAEPAGDPPRSVGSRAADLRLPPTRTRPMWTLAGLALAGVGLFALPAPAGDIAIAGAIVGRRWRSELGVQYWTPSERRSPDNDRVGGRIQLAAAELRGCFVPALRTVEFPLCGVVVIGAMIGRGVGALAPSRSAAAPWSALGVGPTVIWRPPGTRGWLGLVLRVEGYLALTQPAFATSSRTVYRAAPGALRITAGLELRWPRAP